MIPIVDGHHRLGSSGQCSRAIFRPNETIRRDYPIEEYLADIAGSNVVKSVHVRTNRPRERYEDEAAWVQKTAEATLLHR
jgi:predicted TIM-barrel fold metal-dependent hydrolase